MAFFLFKKERNWEHLHAKDSGTKHTAYIIENITGIFLMIKFCFFLCPTKENSLFLKVILLKAIKRICQNVKRTKKTKKVTEFNFLKIINNADFLKCFY